MKKRILGILLACVLAFGALSGCAKKAEEPAPVEESSDKTVVIGLYSDLKTLDPGYMYEVFGNLVSYATYDMLFRIKGNDMAAPAPSLVKDWTLDETSTVYTFNLIDNAVFTSGNPLTSKDVLWSINRVKNLESNNLPYVEGIESLEAPDDYTVVITLKEPDASFLTKLANNAFSILDSELVKENGGSDNAEVADTAKEYLDSHSAGSGPYILSSWTPNVELVLEKNPNYWGETGNVEKFIIKEIPDSNTQIQMLEAGEIDIAFTLNSDNISQLEGKEGIETVRGQAAVCSFLFMNMDPEVGGPMSDPKVQQAVRYAIDYAGLKGLAGEGATLPLSFVPMGFTGALAKPDDYQDVEKAKQLMAEAGYAEGFEVNLITATFDSEGMAWTTIAQKVQSDLAEIGITVNIETTEIGTAIDKYRLGEAGFLVMHWSPDYYDINNQLAFLPGGTVGLRANWTEDAAPEIVESGKRIIGEADNELRAQYSEETQELMAENSPYAFLVQHPKCFAISDRLENVVYNDLNKLQLSEMNVK